MSGEKFMRSFKRTFVKPFPISKEKLHHKKSDVLNGLLLLNILFTFFICINYDDSFLGYCT